MTRVGTLLATLMGTDSPPGPRPGRLSVPVLCVPPEPAERSWQQRAGDGGGAGPPAGAQRAAALLAALGLRDEPWAAAS